MTTAVIAARTTAGGDDPTKFDPIESWYPVFYIEDLDKLTPTPFTLLDRDLVIWWDTQASQWRAFDDRCPHRLARLSEGRIAEDGLLECPYHGWAFTGNGTCDRIPQQLPDAKAETSRRACVKSLPTAVEQGLLFIYAGTPARAEQTPIPLIPVPMVDGKPTDGWLVLNTFRDLPYDALTLLENVLDPSHLPYTHHGSVGKRSNASPVELEVTSSDKLGFTGTWADGPRKGTLGRQNTTFIAPCLMWHELTSKQFGETITVVYATPKRKGECRIFARFPFKFASKVPEFFIKATPEWYSHINNNAILEDDQIFLHHQERYLEQSGGSTNFSQSFYLPTKADAFVFEYRQWLNDYRAEPFPGQTFKPPLTTERLLDRYHSHTEHCHSCSTAYKNIQTAKSAIVIIALLAWISTTILGLTGSENALFPALISIGIVLGGTLGWWGLNRLQTKLERGDRTPARNRK
ncbi:Rieske 2Fe-2S domain-containing protein [Chamaesiphon minutus]|uniref:Ring-hydroxylating dioxygenase, large terminal subunit n=1 Tax=Chamaesiphon minutus (strain ATCC 27169 / PCC 6605) TaxID=1173020 RepID=K9UNF7_CHAP6|nr:Rieske 2Fe-2S domain-containing protein [Chamaesiphon minutus]AFY95729.1 ring-hydroxylating dioxygenase, large terminal subunit [Chamaesiphon minutus PCC 6605]